MKGTKLNVVLMGVSYFDGMASSTRVRNLLDPAVKQKDLVLHNIIYESDAHGLTQKKGKKDGVFFTVLRASRLSSTFSFLWNGIHFLRNSKSNHRKNIVYHYQYVDIKNIILLCYAKSLGYKIVLDIVEDNALYTEFPSFKNKLKISSSIFFLKLTPYIAHGILAISRHLYSLMTSVCKDKVAVHLVPITVDLSKFESKPSTLHTDIKVFYGGSFAPKDGIACLISAFDEVSSKFDNLELILTGRTTTESYDKLKHLIDKVNAKKKISYKGYLDNDAYNKVVNECDIFCMIRTNSEFANAGFPFKLGEFLSTGKAVIATNVGDIPHYLAHKKNALIINPDSTDELVDSLTYLVKNPDVICKIGQGGREVAKEHFDTYIWSKKLMEIFSEI